MKAQVRFLRAILRSLTRKLLTAMERRSGEPNFASWNQLDRWLRQVEGLRRVA
jgi:hypothetical protein